MGLIFILNMLFVIYILINVLIDFCINFFAERILSQALEKHARQDAFDKVLADFLEKYDAAPNDLSEEDLEDNQAEATLY